MCTQAKGNVPTEIVLGCLWDKSETQTGLDCL